MNTTKLNQRGVNAIDFFIWIILALAVMGGVVTMFVSASKTMATASVHTQQQGAILEAVNRITRDFTNSDPVVTATSTEVAVDIAADSSAKEVDRRRYTYDHNAKMISVQSIKVQRGTVYQSTDFAAAPKKIMVTDLTNASLTYFDKGGAPVTELSGIARMDIKLTASVANVGNVELSSSASTRSLTSGGAAGIVVSCPTSLISLNSNGTVDVQWVAADGATGYSILRNNGVVATVTAETGKDRYQFTDRPVHAGTVLNYSVAVTGSHTVCPTSTVILSTQATELSTALLPATTYDASSTPVSTAWTSSSDTNRVKVSWVQIPLSSGYQIFKQQVDKNGQLIGSGRTLIYSTDDEGVTSYTDTIPSFDAGERWQYSIKVQARTGDNDQSNTVTVLTYPAPVVTVSVKASDYGTNTLTWTHDAGLDALGYDIYRSALDTPSAGFTKLNGAPVTGNSYEDRTAALGSTYGYYVVAINRSGFSNQFKSTQVQQLQFPADPIMVAVGANGSRDLNDGTNQPQWSSVKSATSYLAEADGKTIASTTGTSYDHAGRSAATQTSYRALAVNATGTSQGKNAPVILTQRPSAPTASVTSAPTLDTTTASIGWNATAGSWCTAQTCSYKQDRFNNAGARIDVKNVFGTSASFDGQDWGRHYTYTVAAKNAALFNGGWSNASNLISADTYPGDFSLSAVASDPWGTNSQRFMFTTTAISSNTSETTHTLGSLGAQYVSLGWTTSAGAGKYDWARTSSCTPASSCTGSASASMPTSQSLSGSVAAGGTWAWDVAAPGTTYATSVTAKSAENNLTRDKSGSPVTTPADLPQQGYQKIVCSGPWDAPPASIVTNSDAANYARRTFTPQSYGSRLINFKQAPKYGAYSGTIIQGKYQTASAVASRYNWFDSWGNAYMVERMAKGSESNYTGGYWYNYNAGAAPSGGVFDSNAVGQAQHRYKVGTGMKIYNRLWNDPSLDSYWIMTIVDEEATRGGCAPSGQFQEPSDACYEWNGDGACTTLNQYSTDGRPRWFTF